MKIGQLCLWKIISIRFQCVQILLSTQRAENYILQGNFNSKLY